MKIEKNNPVKNFYLILIINSILWVLVESFRSIISKDSMEAVIWGNLLSFGTHKHPPLSGWLAGSFYHMFGDNNIGVYVLGVTCVLIGLIYIYKLATQFLDTKKAICSSLILTSCFYYSFHIFYDNFNCNVISMALWPIMTYYFYKALKFDRIKHWIIFGLLAGLSFMAKYQVVFLFLGMFIYMLCFEKKYFVKKNLYVSILIGSIIILPHIIWLFQNDFFSLLYFVGRTHSAADEGVKISIISRLMFSVKFFLDQILALAPCLALYSFLILKEKKVAFDSHKNNIKDKFFILLIGLLPILIIGSTGIFTASRVVGAWGATMVGWFGIILFYFFPVELKDNTYKFFVKCAIVFMLLWQVAMLIFVLVQTKIDMAYPQQQIMQNFNNIWFNKTGKTELKYVAGETNYTFPFELYYNKNQAHKPKVILDTYGHANPWINAIDVVNSGVIVFGNNEDEAINYAKVVLNLFGYSADIETNKYEFKIKNKLFTKDYEFYYVIIYPDENKI